MFLIILLGVIAAIVIGVLLLLRQQQDTHLTQTNSLDRLPVTAERTLFTLQLGDIVQYQNVDWIIEGKLIYDDEGFIWLEYMLQDGEQTRWLSVEEDDRVETVWMEPVEGVSLSAHPPETLTLGDDTFRVHDRGTAQMTRQGNTLNRNSERCRYIEYASTSQKRLSVEVWGDQVEVSIGRRILPSSLTLLPGDGRRVYRAE